MRGLLTGPISTKKQFGVVLVTICFLPIFVLVHRYMVHEVAPSVPDFVFGPLKIPLLHGFLFAFCGLILGGLASWLYEYGVSISMFIAIWLSLLLAAYFGFHYTPDDYRLGYSVAYWAGAVVGLAGVFYYSPYYAQTGLPRIPRHVPSDRQSKS